MWDSQGSIRRHPAAEGSDRAFGLVFCAVLALVGLWPLLGGSPPRWPALAASGLFLGLALLAPARLGPLNRLWLRFGRLLHRVMNPVILALLFFGAVLPMALLLRLMGKDLLRLKPDPGAATYWMARRPVPGSSFTKQL